jgi:hypothetical protein
MGERLNFYEEGRRMVVCFRANIGMLSCLLLLLPNANFYTDFFEASPSIFTGAGTINQGLSSMFVSSASQ